MDKLLPFFFYFCLPFIFPIASLSNCWKLAHLSVPDPLGSRQIDFSPNLNGKPTLPNDRSPSLLLGQRKEKRPYFTLT